MRRLTVAVVPLFLSSSRGASSHSSPVPGLVDHCRLLQRILREDSPSESARRRRVRGVVQAMEAHYPRWLGESGPGECRLVLESLSAAARYIRRPRGGDRSQGSQGSQGSIGSIGSIGSQGSQGSSGGGRRDPDEWTGASPHFSAGASDWLCACLERSAAAAAAPADCHALLSAAAALELSDAATLLRLCHRLTRREHAARAQPEDLAQTLSVVSALVARCRMPVPPLDHVLCRLPAAELSPRDALRVLSALARLRGGPRGGGGGEVARAVSRRAVAHVASYGPRDVAFALEAAARLTACHEAFTAAALGRCEALAPQLRAGEVGAVCRHVARMRVAGAAPAYAREMRRLLPALLARAEQLLGEFTLQDAQCVLRCFEHHGVRHAVVLARLTPIAGDNG